jgi:undecaprenyl-diphosphatase
MIARPPLAVPLGALVGFVTLLGLTIAGWPALDRFDSTVSEYFREYGDTRPGLVALIRVGTDVAATGSYLFAGLAVTVALAARGQRRLAGCCAIVTIAVPMLWGLGHWLLHRPRPLDGFVVVESNGFPSGHASNAAAAALLAVLLLWPRQARAGRMITVVLAGGFAVVIGVTRLALLAHWPADVLGGWLLALTVVPLAARVVPPRAPVRTSRTTGPTG